MQKILTDMIDHMEKLTDEIMTMRSEMGMLHGEMSKLAERVAILQQETNKEFHTTRTKMGEELRVLRTSMHNGLDVIHTNMLTKEDIRQCEE